MDVNETEGNAGISPGSVTGENKTLILGKSGSVHMRGKRFQVIHGHNFAPVFGLFITLVE